MAEAKEAGTAPQNATETSSASQVGISQEERETIEKIKAFLEEGQGLDVYQYAAFKLAVHLPKAKGVRETCAVLIPSVLLPLIAMTCQLVTLGSLWYEHFEWLFDDDWLTVDDDAFDDYDDSIIATNPALWIALKLFVCLYTLKLYMEIVNSGFYGAMRSAPTTGIQQCQCMDKCLAKLNPYIGDAFGVFLNYGFLNMPIFVAGFIIHTFCWYACLVINEWMLDITEDPLKAVLNIVAVFFVLELDNMLVPYGAYEDILKYFEKEDNGPREKGNSAKVHLFFQVYFLIPVIIIYVYEFSFGNIWVLVHYGS